ncbi:MAG: hypothetical protein KBF76_04710 [Verrucomicrobiales bacterium]|jgi:hypothetical protein|nr:hypothetical protein [Verrucomicrobiales bacterium]
MNSLRFVIMTLVLPLSGGWAYAFDELYERAPIHYNEAVANTAVTRLIESAAKDKTLSTGTDREILGKMLSALKIPIESQVLVFSKTSAQNSRISPETPRALYYSDDVYLGWVQGGDIEVASFDPKIGVVFHLVKLTTRQAGHPPELVRERSCLNCHAGSSNQNMPGLMVRSVFPSDSGLPIFEAGTYHTRQSSPISERWGGWYVTGEVEGNTHLGNVIASIGAENHVELKPFSDGKVIQLDDFLRSSPYLNGGKSDVVALMVLEHQVGVHNVLVEANLTTRATMHRHIEMQKAFGEPIDAPLSETNDRILTRLADKVLHEMLYVDEIALEGGIDGSLAFQDAFARNQRKSKDGRSLKDFRLYGRLMKYRCSHLIYSTVFESLPPEIKTRILDQLHGILTEPAAWPEYAHLGDSERGHIREILLETLPGLPPSWH